MADQSITPGPRVDVGRLAWRLASGHHLDGVHRTDAGWVTRGRSPLAPQHRASWWATRARAERAAYRLGGAGLVAGELYGLASAPTVTMDATRGIALAAALAGGYRTAGTVLTARHRWEWVRPLHRALAGPLGIPEGTRPASYLHIPRDYHSRTDVGRIDLPAAFVGVDGGQSTVAAIVKTKLGLTDVSVTFKLAGRRPHLLLRQSPRPPAKALFADASVRERVEAAPESAPLIGIGPQGITVSVDLDAESPHILVSASTGGGKSVITRTMAAQILHNGGRLVVLDFKRHSHKWARGLPGVRYCRDIEEIHDALVTLGAEGHLRNIAVDEWEGEGEAPVGARLGILVEEANATIAKLKRHWTAIRSKEDPKESPAIDALREVLFMGRAVKMHVLLVAQSATAAALGGPEVRECFATRILARYTRNAWMMLVPEVQPIPRSTRHIGRAQVVLGGIAHETQVCFMTDTEAREWATAGTPTQGGQECHVTLPEDPSTWEESVYVSRDVTPHLTLVKPETVPPQQTAEPRYSLAAAAREGIVPLTADALRQAKRRDPEFPAGDAGAWTAEELQRWYRNRPRAVNAGG